MEKEIKLTVEKSEVKETSIFGGIQGEGGARTLRISFDDEWTNLSKRITFYDGTMQNPVSVMLTEDKKTDGEYIVKIPSEPLKTGGKLIYIIDGSADGIKQRSVQKQLRVKFAPPLSENEAADITPSVLEQLEASVDDITKNYNTISEVLSENVSLSKELETRVFAAEQNLKAKADNAVLDSISAVINKESERIDDIEKTVSKTENALGEKADKTDLEAKLDTKVDKTGDATIQGKLSVGDINSTGHGLFSNGVTSFDGSSFHYLEKKADKTELENLNFTLEELEDKVDEKVDKEDGKGLSNIKNLTVAEYGIDNEAYKMDLDNHTNSFTKTIVFPSIGYVYDTFCEIETKISKSIPKTTETVWNTNHAEFTDMLSGENPINLKVYGSCLKNLITYPSAGSSIPKGGEKTLNGITVKDSGNGTYTINGTSTGSSYFTMFFSSIVPTSLSGKYTLSISAPNSSTCCGVMTELYDANGKWIYGGIAEEDNPFTFDMSLYSDKVAKLLVSLYFPLNSSFDNTLVLPQLEIGETATDFMPYFAVGDWDSEEGKYKIPITLCGTNLISSYYDFSAVEKNGVTLTCLEEGKIKVSGTPTASINQKLGQVNVLPNTEYTLGGIEIGKNLVFIVVEYDSSGTKLNTYSSRLLNITTSDEASYFLIYLDRINSNAEIPETVVKPMLVFGNKEAEFEPYCGETTATISLSKRLGTGQYIDLSEKKLYTQSGTEKVTVTGSLLTTDGAINNLSVKTYVKPSKIETEYYQDINKVLNELKLAILSQGGNV